MIGLARPGRAAAPQADRRLRARLRAARVRRADGDRRAAHARRDRGDPRRRLHLRGRDRGRRHHRPRLPDQADADGRRRRGDRRLHRLGAAGGRARQRDLRGHGVGDLQRVPPPHRSDDPAQRGLLPAVHDHRAAGDDRELLVPRARRRRQHGDEPADHRHGLRRAAARDPRRVAASCGGTSSPFLFGGIDPRTGEPYAHFHFEGVGWGGRQGLDGNNMVVTINGNCRNTPVEVFETRYPGVPDRVVPARPRLGRPGRVPRRPRRRAHLHRHRARGDRERAPEPDEDGAVGRARRRRGRGRRPLGAPVRQRRVADVRRGVRDDVAVEVLRRDAARRRPGADPDAGRRRLRRPARARPREACARDVAEGFVSAEAARAVYGLED